MNELQEIIVSIAPQVPRFLNEVDQYLKKGIDLKLKSDFYEIRHNILSAPGGLCVTEVIIPHSPVPFVGLGL